MNIERIKLYLNRPEYIFRPNQIYHRIFDKELNLGTSHKHVVLPWGLQIKIPTSNTDVVGKAISAYGVYDLSLTEIIWRLVGIGETAVDIGANIGYVTSIMAKRVGASGQVWCFEPNPEVYSELSVNVNSWKHDLGWNNIHTEEIALSDKSGSGILNITPNRGESFIDNGDTEKDDFSCGRYNVRLERLENFFEKQRDIGLLKNRRRRT